MPYRLQRRSWKNRFRYWFDNSMAAGTIALIGWLAAASLLVVLFAATVITFAHIRPGDREDLTLLEAAWQSLMRTLDPGTMGGDEGWGFRVVMLGVTLGGILVVSTLIGVLTSGIEGKLDELRKGRSFVLETDHTLILGWSESIFTIIGQLVEANANQRNPRIVVMAGRDKVDMEDEIRAKAGPLGRTRVICRRGDPIDHYDLEIVNPHEAKSIILVSDDTSDADTHVIKSILAITNNPARRKEPYHIVAEIRDPRNLEVARMVGKDEVTLILSDDFISRITVQTCRQSGLSVLYEELLDFQGNEIYFQEEPSLVGKSFAEALLACEDSVPIGIRYASGSVCLVPPMATRLAAGDRLIAIAEDDDRIRPSGLAQPPVDGEAIRSGEPDQSVPERTLILGWNRRGPLVINELDRYVAPGSEVQVVACAEAAREEIARLCGSLRNQRCAFQEGDTTSRVVLDMLGVPGCSHVIVLGYTDNLPPQEADARTLITLLHLRNIVEQTGSRVSIVSEMLDLRNRELAEVTQADDFIVSEKLVSLALAQLSENRELRDVYADIFDPAGNEVYLRPAAAYVELGRPVTFYTVVQSAADRGEVAVGYRVAAAAGSPENAYGVVVNPRKSERVAFTERDRIIILGES